MPNCVVCGDPAGPEAWRTMCRACYRKMKRREEEELEGELAAWRERCLRAERALRTAPAALSADRLKKLIQLCHPDKHNGSKAATEMTQWLLAQREKL